MKQTQKMFTEMGKFNEELAKAGIIKDGRWPEAQQRWQAHQVHGRGHTSVIDGPFAETKELVAGFWIWEVKSLDEAVDWAKRCPNPMPGEEGVLEIRPFYEMRTSTTCMTDEIREREGRVRKLVEASRSRRRSREGEGEG